MIDTVVCGDCLDVMRDIPDGSVDLTVTSPPYDNLREYMGYTFDFEGIAKELFRVTKKGGVVVWVVGDATINGSETGTSFRQALYFKEIGFNLHDTMIYEKARSGGARGSNMAYWQAFEYMFVLSKEQLSTFFPIADRKNTRTGSICGGGRRNKDGSIEPTHRMELKEYGKRTNVWRITPETSGSVTDHPAPFPEKLARDHILSWSNVGDLVLDPMCGSGTTCKMAATYKRNFIGIDISEEYCEIARKRVEPILMQVGLGL